MCKVALRSRLRELVQSNQVDVKKLFELFVDSENAMQDCVVIEDEILRFARIEEITEIQWEIAKFSSKVQCKLIKDVLFKLAIWRRWYSSELELPEEMQLSDSLVYSAYVNLAQILGENTLMATSDKVAAN